ncbi:hypothetical protein Rhopal_007448-T1 [Rhodotorula paludigena]|uniref:Proteophosphoglycan ppg4 n=1 Tax=Rhodotorula paludigena TaxID=86838 RepID=A0AAV5GYU2_9BASI|nr:hypothetical protein Rhopal_007448-T1 [Rhodotorula paludigena]
MRQATRRSSFDRPLLSADAAGTGERRGLRRLSRRELVATVLAATSLLILLRLLNTYAEDLPPIQWNLADQRLRQYAFATPPIHATLQEKLDDLDTHQNRTRTWILDSRIKTTGATGIGLGAEDPPRVPQPALPSARHWLSPGSHEGPGHFSGGSRHKYKQLVQEWRTGRPVEACEKGNWEDEYTQMHADMLSGTREASLMEYICPEGAYCGGFADRLLGMVSVFLYSVLTKRAFSMTWEKPAPLDLFFDSPYIDWSRPFNETLSTVARGPYVNSTISSSRKFFEMHNLWPRDLDTFFHTFATDYAAEALGFKLNTMYSCLINYLIRPKAAAIALIAQYTSFFAMPRNFVIGVQIRTGDKNMWSTDAETVDKHAHYFACAEAVAATYAEPSQTPFYYLITDSHALELDAVRRFGKRVVVTGLRQAHVELPLDWSKTFAAFRQAADGFMNTIIESWIFAGTDFQILTSHSGFGKIPTWIRGRENTTIVLFNEHTDPIYTQEYKDQHGGHLPPAIDCSRPEAIKTFTEMAQDWSLG